VTGGLIDLVSLKGDDGGDESPDVSEPSSLLILGGRGGPAASKRSRGRCRGRCGRRSATAAYGPVMNAGYCDSLVYALASIAPSFISRLCQ
jgi:hypothetical protein